MTGRGRTKFLDKWSPKLKMQKCEESLGTSVEKREKEVFREMGDQQVWHFSE